VRRQVCLLNINSNNNKLCERPPQYPTMPVQVDLRPFDLESGVRVTCDVGYSLHVYQF